MPQNGISQFVFHPDAHEEGGLCCNNDELLNEQRKAIMEWIKSMGQRLLTGNINLINTPFPVVMFEPRSYLEKLADVWVYPKFLSKAAASSDPVERLKWTITWFIAGLHHSFEKWKKPFNPILGETWEARLSDGSNIAMEQISHHPPISAFHLAGPRGTYSFVGLSQPSVTLQLKQRGFKTVAKGFRYVQFADGTRIEMHYPSYSINGVVNATRPCAEVEGKAVFIDVQHKLQATIAFGAVKGATSPLLRRSDAVTGHITTYDGGKASSSSSFSNQVTAPPASAPRRSDSGAAASDDEFASASENEFDPDEEGGASAGPEDFARKRTVSEDVAASLAWPETLDVKSDVGRHSDRLDLRPGPTYGSSSSARYDVPPVSSTLSSTSSSSFVLSKSASHKEGGSATSMFGMKKLSKMFGGLMSSSTEEGASSSPTSVLAHVQGSWLSHLQVGDERTWTLAEAVPDRWEALPDALPSDSRYRMDLAILKSGDIRGAQEWKERLENEQRADKKLRSKH